MALAVAGMGESFSDNAAVQELASALMKQLAQYQEPWGDDIQHYVFRDGTQEGSTATRELAIDMIRQYQKRETHPILRAEEFGKETMMQKKYELCLRLSQEEKDRLEDSARRCGLSKTAYLRRLICGAEIRARPTQEIKDLRTEIHHIGNNINQIARSVNAGIARAEDARRGLYLLDQVYELMYQIAKK